MDFLGFVTIFYRMEASMKMKYLKLKNSSHGSSINSSIFMRIYEITDFLDFLTIQKIIKRTPAQSTKMRLCAFRESTFIEEQMYAIPICKHGCTT